MELSVLVIAGPPAVALLVGVYRERLSRFSPEWELEVDGPEATAQRLRAEGNRSHQWRLRELETVAVTARSNNHAA